MRLYYYSVDIKAGIHGVELFHANFNGRDELQSANMKAIQVLIAYRVFPSFP